MSTFPDHVDNMLSLQKLGVDISEHLEDGEISLGSWHYDNLVYLMRQSLGRAYAFKSERDTLAQRVEGLELSNKLIEAGAESDRKQNRQLVQDRDLLRQRVKELEADKREMLENLSEMVRMWNKELNLPCETVKSAEKTLAKQKGEG